MATMTRVLKLIAPLIESGRIYYGQPAESMEAILRAECRKWRTVYPDGSGHDWGNGPNEDIGTLAAECRQRLYGGPTVDYALICRCDSFLLRYGGWDHVLDVLLRCRSGGSPYAVDAMELADYALARQREGRDCISVTMDSGAIARSVSAYRNLQRYGASTAEADECADSCVPAEDVQGGHEIVQMALAVAWLRRRNWAVNVSRVYYLPAGIWNVASRIPPAKMRLFVLAAQEYQSVDDALTVIRCPIYRDLRTAEEMFAALRAIREAAGRMR